MFLVHICFAVDSTVSLQLPAAPPLPHPLLDSEPSILISHSAPGNLHQLGPDPFELLPSSSHTHTIFFTSNDKRDDPPPEATLQDLSEYIIKDEDYPVARGRFWEIWKCTFDIGRNSVKVAVKALQVYVDDQVGAAKTKNINRMTRELMICANLHHANILPVYGYTTGFGPFIAIVTPWRRMET
ncbi:hypothetical protein BDR07DRAFT_1461278 [Suillus spraguei]|nr:hypothetical protein BDR07DRAFT_1461278 [Suillus spraguei]